MQNMLLSSRSQIFTKADPYEVSDYVNAHVGSHSIKLPSHGCPQASLEHRKFASMDLCQLSYGGRVTVATTSLDTIYHLQILLTGHCQWRGREGEHLFIPGELMIINPDEPVVLTYSDDCKKLIIKMPVGLLDRSCQENHWLRPEAGIRFARACHSLPVLGGLDSLIQLLCAEAENSVFPPQVQDYYANILSSKLLSLLPHNGLVVPPQDHKTSFDALLAHIDQHLTQDFTVGQLARLAGVSERSLYGLFERFTASSPLHYVRSRKLHRVHSLLSDPSSPVRNITEVALDYGFLNPGRFAQSYKQLFGELPSQTYQRYRNPLQ